MSDSRKKMLEKVKAILAKTMENGCTEEEAMTALAKARELMATYEIDEAELDAAEQEEATLHRTEMRDPYEIKRGLFMAVGRFTSCVAYMENKRQGINFCGLESDVIFATWLLETLQRFVMRALREYQKQRMTKKMTSSNYTSASFVIGCVARISEKLDELSPKIETKNELVMAELTKNGVTLRNSSRSREVHAGSALKGMKAGDSARFDKPVGSKGSQLRLK